MGSFQWQQLPKSDVLDPRCQALRRADSMITLPLSRFTLGATQSQVWKSLGSPTAKDSERLIYLHEHDVTTKAARCCHLLVDLCSISRMEVGPGHRRSHRNSALGLGASLR